MFTVVPVKELSKGSKFAPIGLLKMFNSGGAIKALDFESERNATVNMEVCGCGLFGAYSSTQPKRVMVDSEEMESNYEAESGLVTVVLRVPEQELNLWDVTIEL